jgi:hypothetical protein
MPVNLFLLNLNFDYFFIGINENVIFWNNTNYLNYILPHVHEVDIVKINDSDDDFDDDVDDDEF